MKIYEMFDEGRGIGTLIYYEKEKTFIIELMADLDEWSAPVLFSGFVKKNVYTIPRDVSLMWVMERVIPSGRQNISAILKNHKLKEYDEMKFLEISEGKCSQDEIHIKKTDKLPGYVKKRMKKNLVDSFVSDETSLICFFADDTTEKIDMNLLLEVDGVDKILKNRKLFESCKVGTGGYFVTFNDSIDIPASVLYKAGKKLPITRRDFITFVQKNVYDTTQSCEELECSRQNLSYMVRRDQLTPIKEDVMGNLYLKGDVVRNKW